MNRSCFALTVLLFSWSSTPADEAPRLIVKPETYQTLINPNCSHCIDESKRRAQELRKEDPVLCWIRGYSDGGAIPIRFFLNPYRVISDSYGVFVYDPDAGYARGFAPSYNFRFHGWRNGIMVMKDITDGTLFSCLSGIAFEGPRKGKRLTPVPTLTTTWSNWLDAYPNAVAYHMFDKYKPVELPKTEHADSLKSRGKTDPRLRADELVLGVRIGNRTKAYPLGQFKAADVYPDTLGGEKIVILHQAGNLGGTSAFKPVASQPRKFKGPRPNEDGVSPSDAGVPLPDGKELSPRKLDLSMDWHGYSVDFPQSGSLWDSAGRARSGPLRGWTLEPVDSVVCKWFAWSAEYPETEISTTQPEPAPAPPAPVKPAETEKEVAGTAEFLRVLPKPFATLKAVDPKARTVTLQWEGEKESKVWPVEPDAEIKVMGWWGRLQQFRDGDRVWVWMKLNRKKEPVSVMMLADEPSEQDIHGFNWLITRVDLTAPAQRSTIVLESKKSKLVFESTPEITESASPGKTAYFQTANNVLTTFWIAEEFEKKRAEQKNWLRKRWIEEGLPGTLTFHHVFSGELEFMLDHEAMRWGRSLKKGDVVHLSTEPAVKGVVKVVTPWRERTLVRLVVGELESSELKIGQRLNLKMTVPSAAVEQDLYPPDMNRSRTKDERIKWFLASIYCVCGVSNNTCTGHFYTLASCNPNGCGAPNATKKKISDWIDQGKNDKEIWDLLLKERGPLLLKPHLKP